MIWRQHRRMRQLRGMWSDRSGYTVLELMISLALLATLLTVAWSILGSYRDAEQRGWNQAYQMQMIRVTRSWLESDAAHLMEPRSQPSSLSKEAAPFSLQPFKGDEQGFEVDFVPSVDPLLWLEAITQTAEPLSSTTQAMDVQTQNRASSLDPIAVHHLRYKLVAEASSDTEEERYALERQRSPIDRWSNASTSSRSEELLTTEDLYRLSDDESLEDPAAPRKLAAMKIRNMVTPRFRYSDGQSWTSNWDSQLKGRLPRAIELSFDLPSAATMKQSSEPKSEETEAFVAEDFASSESASELALAAEPTATLSEDDEALDRDVRIVVLVPGSDGGGRNDP
ncbi:prepilin-type N-terminal cleavage/methylation domain-containing protein [Novipirellula artificiosorum]|uniref:Pseudopilin GspJ n=1 Tax=Novipirellula artificiosorum TaxID=2528016 RepID=A0A5C6DSL3_9BACT|nr:prepilin-type N-terminal cleavage/methylation domain-containing protein [Novipirellula artificiosorum]TWU38481.1 hypothetical protein Poly41_29570 [Novipirellula artificiosorum]